VGILNIVKVEDEAGRVSVYKAVNRSSLKVGLGNEIVPSKLVGYKPAEEAAGVPTFKEFLAQRPVEVHVAEEAT